MKKIAAICALALMASACSNPQPVNENVQVSSTEPVTTSSTVTVTEAAGQENVEIAQVIAPKTVSGGSGSTCLAVDVLANDGAFIRAGTAGTLSGDTFSVNGASHDLSGINYSVKPC